MWLTCIAAQHSHSRSPSHATQIHFELACRWLTARTHVFDYWRRVHDDMQVVGEYIPDSPLCRILMHFLARHLVQRDLDWHVKWSNKTFMAGVGEPSKVFEQYVCPLTHRVYLLPHIILDWKLNCDMFIS